MTSYSSRKLPQKYQYTFLGQNHIFLNKRFIGRISNNCFKELTVSVGMVTCTIKVLRLFDFPKQLKITSIQSLTSS